MSKKKQLSPNTKGDVRSIETIFEIIILAVTYFLVWRNAYAAGTFPDYFGKGKYVLMGVYALLAFLFVKHSDGFLFGDLRRFDLALAQWIGLFITNFITYFQLCLIANKMISPLPIVFLMVADVFVSTLFIFFYTAIYHRLYAPYNMVMVFGNSDAVGMKIKMDKRREKYQVNKLLSTDLGYEAICRELMKYDAVVINDVPAQMRNDLLKFCYQRGIRTYVVPKITDLIMRGADAISIFDTPLVVTGGFGLTFGHRFCKRALDIFVSAFGLLLASPIFLGVAIAIKCDDNGPIFYRQTRVTEGDREFQVIKFRSMIVDAEKVTGAVLATADDARITKVGRFIRASRLDEIPQLLNVLKGDMSLVGPRPERKVFIDEFCREMPEFAYRTKVKAGMTGYAQIYGKYNTTPYDKLRLDMMYIENYSFFLDVKLILTTIRILFSSESTEGVDKARELEQMKRTLLQEIYAEEKQTPDDSDQ